MSYTKTNWEDLPSKNTPATATRLNNMENGIKYSYDNVEKIIEGLSNPTVQGEGENITLNNTNKGVFNEFKVEGNTTQETRSGKNKFNIASVNNLALGSTVVYSTSYRGYYLPVTAGEKWTVSRKATNTPNRFRIAFTVEQPTGGTAYYNEAGNVQSFVNLDEKIEGTVTVPQGMSYLFLYLSNENETITEDMQIQIENNPTKTDYEQYGVMPSVDYPSLIHDVGDDINLLDLDNVTLASCVKQSNGSYRSSFTNNYFSSVITTALNNFLMQNRGKNIIFSIDKNLSGKMMSIVIFGTRTSGGTYQEINQAGLDFVSGQIASDFTKINRVELRWNRSSTAFTDTTTVVSEIQLRLGAEKKPYKEYNVADFTTKINAKNRFNKDKIVSGFYLNTSGDLEANGNCAVSEFIEIEEGETYYISKRNTNRTKFYDKNKIPLTLSFNVLDDTNYFTVPENAKYIRTSINVVTQDINTFQIVKTTTAPTYEEFKEQSIVFPLEEGQRLHEGDYLAEDGIHQVRNAVIFDGSSDESWSLAGSGATKRFQITLSDAKQYATTTIPNVYCNSFIKNSADEIYRGKSGIGFNANTIWVDDEYESTVDGFTLEQWKTWLAENPIKIEYELAEEKIIPYTDEQKIAYLQLQTLRSYKGQTHISSEDETSPIYTVEAQRDLGAIFEEVQS